MHGFWTVDGNRESLRHKGFASRATTRSRSENPLFWKDGPRGSTDRPIQSFSIKPIYKGLPDQPSDPSAPLNHGKSSDYRTCASLSTYPFRWREPTRAKLWAPRQSTSYDGSLHPADMNAGWDNAYTHQNTHATTSNFQYGSFWFDLKLQPKPRVFSQTQVGPGWYPVTHGTRP